MNRYLSMFITLFVLLAAYIAKLESIKVKENTFHYSNAFNPNLISARVEMITMIKFVRSKTPLFVHVYVKICLNKHYKSLIKKFPI